MGLRDRLAARQRHTQLLAAANRTIHTQLLHGNTLRPEPATMVALSFAMFAIRLDAAEARDYLNAALAERGYPLLNEGGDQ
ncbi:hypothetical protein DMA15_17525 [Streptomyces sp. WAC 01529]|uniref:hypothetical protein n=1 Tax=Streptomyces sp. WAC 01529 TaxID=2203205 RepID=UPI000F71E689|nr:hypothetical protein [Streptomyces sp. WAC 01529]AZM54148.1 hypothetical protein DMA15_17525 [Streptomyces sp. WAC 01529]